MTANELMAAVEAPPMPDFHVQRHEIANGDDCWTILPLTQEGRLMSLDLDCELRGQYVVCRHFEALVALCDQLFDSGLRCV